MKTRIKALLENGTVDGFFAYKTIHGFLFPHFFTRENAADLEEWGPNEARYPITKLLLAKARENPALKLGVLVRGCEERSLRELFKWSQLDPEKVVVVGQCCPEGLAKYCECWKPFPDAEGYGKPPAPVVQSARVAELDAMGDGTRLGWWLSHLNRCIHCFGCRDVCPVCWCTTCSLEKKEVSGPETLPPDTSFHLVRAVHMAGRCIDCGMCEEVCPAKIPLRALYKKVNDLVVEIFDYKTGGEGKSPFTLLGDETLLPAGPR